MTTMTAFLPRVGELLVLSHDIATSGWTDTERRRMWDRGTPVVFVSELRWVTGAVLDHPGIDIAEIDLLTPAGVLPFQLLCPNGVEDVGPYVEMCFSGLDT